MKTTLNLPDDLVQEAKRIALRDGRTLTDMLVKGLTEELARANRPISLPVCSEEGGLVSGVDWSALEAAGNGFGWHR